jgi:hypothetical protein
LVSCSFIEFDERGDYQDFRQHQATMDYLTQLTTETPRDPLMLIFYCHGWRNNSQSEDVVRFNAFLGRLSVAMATEGNARRRRVHGVYLAWRGASVTPTVDPKKGYEFDYTRKIFGGDLIDPGTSFRSPWSYSVFAPEVLSFLTREPQAEHFVSGVPIARTILSCANFAKNDPRTETIVIGHSLGALMLEKALGQSTVALLSSAWRAPKGAPKNSWGIPAGLLPIDCVFLVNSAAPSIFAKELSDFMWAYGQTMEKYGVVQKGTSDKIPVIISITSKADNVTGKYARVGLSLIDPTDLPGLRQLYRKVVLAPENNPHPNDKNAPYPDEHIDYGQVPQRFYNQTTPGHNQLLVDHWIVPIEAPDAAAVDREWPIPADGKAKDFANPEQVMRQNHFAPPIELRAGDYVFRTRQRDEDKVWTWKLTDRPALKAVAQEASTEPAGQRASDILAWSHYGSDIPFPRPSPYWIVQCDKPLIKDHGDVWSDNAMELYMALYDHISRLRGEHNPKPIASDSTLADLPAK